MGRRLISAGAADGVTKQSRDWIRAGMIVMVMLGLYWFACSHAHAATTVNDEFSNVAAKVEGWVTGSLGKLSAFVALAVGSVVAAVKKDWSWFFGAIVLAIGIGIIVTIVNASFTATI